jgi:hypothetical protein
MIRSPGYWIASLLVLGLFGWTWYASYTGAGLPTTAAAKAQRDAIAHRRGVRVGSYGGRYYGGGGPRFGK